MIEVIFFVFFGFLGLALAYNLAKALYYFLLGLLELVWSIVTWPFRLFQSKPERSFPPSYPASPPRSWEPPKPAQPESRYTRDWQQISRKHKESCGWQCQDCGVYLGGSRNERRLLHVHHRDLNPQNNDSYNLESLCVICHSERPGTGHRRLAGAIANDGRRWEVLNLRRYQGK